MLNFFKKKKVLDNEIVLIYIQSNIIRVSDKGIGGLRRWLSPNRPKLIVPEYLVRSNTYPAVDEA